MEAELMEMDKFLIKCDGLMFRSIKNVIDLPNPSEWLHILNCSACGYLVLDHYALCSKDGHLTCGDCIEASGGKIICQFQNYPKPNRNVRSEKSGHKELKTEFSENAGNEIGDGIESSNLNECNVSGLSETDMEKPEHDEEIDPKMIGAAALPATDGDNDNYRKMMEQWNKVINLESRDTGNDICGGVLQHRRHTFIDRLLAEVELICPYMSHGCDAAVPPKHLMRHVLYECPWRSVSEENLSAFDKFEEVNEAISPSGDQDKIENNGFYRTPSISMLSSSGEESLHLPSPHHNIQQQQQQPSSPLNGGWTPGPTLMHWNQLLIPTHSFLRTPSPSIPSSGEEFTLIQRQSGPPCDMRDFRENLSSPLWKPNMSPRVAPPPGTHWVPSGVESYSYHGVPRTRMPGGIGDKSSRFLSHFGRQTNWQDIQKKASSPLHSDVPGTTLPSQMQLKNESYSPQNAPSTSMLSTKGQGPPSPQSHSGRQQHNWQNLRKKPFSPVVPKDGEIQGATVPFRKQHKNAAGKLKKAPSSPMLNTSGEGSPSPQSQSGRQQRNWQDLRKKSFSPVVPKDGEIQGATVPFRKQHKNATGKLKKAPSSPMLTTNGEGSPLAQSPTVKQRKKRYFQKKTSTVVPSGSVSSGVPTLLGNYMRNAGRSFQTTTTSMFISSGETTPVAQSPSGKLQKKKMQQ